MIKLLKKFLVPSYKFFENSRTREFCKLFIFWGRAQRNLEKTLTVSIGKFHVPDILSFVFQFKEIVVEEIYKFTTKKECPVIFDCGANVGLSCAYFKSIYPKANIKAFEADNKVCNFLNENILNNKLEKVVVYNQAVWVHNNGIKFSSDGADGGSIFGSDNLTVVSSIRLYDLLAAEESVAMLKMDIEGAEVEVIKDCANVLDRVENIFVEYHSWRNHPQELNKILQILSEAGFRYCLQTINRQDHPFVNKGDNLVMDLQLNIFAYRI